MKPCAKCSNPKKCMAAGKCAAKKAPVKKTAAKKKPYGPKKGLKSSCWKGYQAVGTKQKGGKTVPNCVPRKK